jgi:nucleotide-binding universal stress UspA family protein
MSTDDTPSDWRVLVPVEILEGETVPDSVVDLLAALPVVVLGYHVLPEQTPPGQARMQFKQRAQGSLNDLAAAFAEAGGDAETRLVFTHDEEQTTDRIADETGCEALLVSNPAPDIERLLVPLRGEVDIPRITELVAALIDDRDIAVTLFHVATSGAKTEAGESMVSDAAARLRDGGVPAGGIETEVRVSGAPVETITTAATDHDAIVMGEREPSPGSFLFGEKSEQVAARSLGPVVVVRRARPSGGTEAIGETDVVEETDGA